MKKTLMIPGSAALTAAFADKCLFSPADRRGGATRLTSPTHDPRTHRPHGDTGADVSSHYDESVKGDEAGAAKVSDDDLAFRAAGGKFGQMTHGAPSAGLGA